MRCQKDEPNVTYSYLYYSSHHIACSVGVPLVTNKSREWLEKGTRPISFGYRLCSLAPPSGQRIAPLSLFSLCWYETTGASPVNVARLWETWLFLNWNDCLHSIKALSLFFLYQQLFAYVTQEKFEDNGWTVYKPVEEFRRQVRIRYSRALITIW